MDFAPSGAQMFDSTYQFLVAFEGVVVILNGNVCCLVIGAGGISADWPGSRPGVFRDCLVGLLSFSFNAWRNVFTIYSSIN